MDLKSRASGWNFGNLLNSTIPDNPILYTTFLRAKPFVNNITQNEVNVTIKGLKNWKTSGSDNIPKNC